MAAKVKLRTLRGILKELKLLYRPKVAARNMFGYSFIMSEYRQSRSADEQMAQDLNRDAENFLCMLTSERRKQELNEYYKGAGEIKIEKIARRVGFKMPRTYIEPDNNSHKT